MEDAGYRLITLDATGSTNDDALAAARQGDPGRLWIMAREQRAGRGRQGRAWASPPGNLYASLLLIDPCEPPLAPQLGFIAGIALHEAVSEATALDPPRLALKWPNDLLIEGAKVAGLLLEAQGRGEGLAVVIGFGVNVASAPSGTPYPAAALQLYARPGLTPETLLAVLAGAFAKRLAAWQAAGDAGAAERFAPIRRAWLQRAAGLGGRVAIRLQSGERTGRFVGLDPTGRLELQTASGLELIDAGDLYFPHVRSGLAESSSTLTG